MAEMSSHDRKRNVRTQGKSPIAQPPRVAITGRGSRNDAQAHSSTESTPSPPSVRASTQEPDSNDTNIPSRSKSLGAQRDGISGEDLASKIATLEIEMAKMEDEFSCELATMADKVAASSELASYWQNKHSVVHQQFLAVDTDLRVLQHENAINARERDEKDKDVKTRISSLLLDRDTLREGYQATKAGLWESERDVERLKGQIKGLKDFVSTSSRVEGQVTDEQIGEMMRGLGNGLQNWVIVNFRKAKMDVSTMPEDTKEDLMALVPTYQDLAATAKVHLIQSIVSRLLVTEIFQSYYVGLPIERSAELRSMELYLEKATGDAASTNQLRSATLSIIQKSLTSNLQEATNFVINDIVTRINRFANHSMALQLTEAGKTSLRALISSAIDLARLLRVQKAVFSPIMPVIQTHHVNTFDVETMEDIGGEDEDSLEKRGIRCVTFPGIIKKGDISGENMAQLRNVIAKARVLCSPD